MATFTRIWVVGAGLAVGGCFGLAGLSYEGDGRLVDHGALSYSHRYELNLGSIDSSHTGGYTFKLSGMPHAEFVVGVEVLDQETYRANLGPPAITFAGQVAVVMTDTAGNLIIDERRPLQDWVRTYGSGLRNSSFYRRGELIDVPIANGNTRPTRIGARASGGWGTYFESEPGETYLLKVDILAPIQPSVPTRISAVGWDRT